MKKIIYFIVLSTLVLYILFFPEPAVAAASFGLMLWYSKMLPTILPFAILSHILVASELLSNAANTIHKPFARILPVSAAGIYPLFAGFLFGFPLGSRITAQMVAEGQMDWEEGNRLFVVCNNISPIFISSFILSDSLKRPDLKAVTLMLLYLPPLCYLWLDRRLHDVKQRDRKLPDVRRHDRQRHIPDNHPAVPRVKKAASRSQINFRIIDAGIMSGFETLTRLGGYIMLFAILAQMTTCIPHLPKLAGCMLVGLTEITNGIAALASLQLPFTVKYPAIIACTAFGGLSGLAQTASMTREAGFSMTHYVKVKLVLSLISAALAVLIAR